MNTIHLYGIKLFLTNHKCFDKGSNYKQFYNYFLNYYIPIEEYYKIEYMEVYHGRRQTIVS